MISGTLLSNTVVPQTVVSALTIVTSSTGARVGEGMEGCGVDHYKNEKVAEAEGRQNRLCLEVRDHDKCPRHTFYIQC